MLVTDDVTEGISPELYALAAHNGYLVDDVNKFVTLARSGEDETSGGLIYPCGLL